MLEDKPIVIVSGEGEQGIVTNYEGEKTLLRVRMTLNRERCGGDRWARAIQYSHEGKNRSSGN